MESPPSDSQLSILKKALDEAEQAEQNGSKIREAEEALRKAEVNLSIDENYAAALKIWKDAEKLALEQRDVVAVLNGKVSDL